MKKSLLTPAAVKGILALSGTMLVLFSVACDPTPRRFVGVTTNESGGLIVLFQPCKSEQVKELRLVAIRGRILGDDDDQVLWHVKARNGSSAVRIEVGRLSQDFEEVVPFSAPPVEATLGVLIETNQGQVGDTFKSDELEPGRILNQNRMLTEEQFRALDTCK